MSSMQNQNVSDERLAFVLGYASDCKLFGVPVYEPGTDSSGPGRS